MVSRFRCMINPGDGINSRREGRFIEIETAQYGFTSAVLLTYEDAIKFAEGILAQAAEAHELDGI